MCSTRNAVRVLLIVLGWSPLGALGLRAQTPPPNATSPGGSIAGVVFDSLVTRAPLAGAEVFIAGYERTVRTDKRGRFRVDALAPGAHDVTFSAPALDSLGLTVPVWSVVVADGRVSTATFATPSPRTVHERLCSTSDASTGVLMGRVRDATSGAPVADARVTATWSDWTLADGAMRRHDRTAAAERMPAARIGSAPCLTTSPSPCRRAAA